jgi:hypothetical protein
MSLLIAWVECQLTVGIKARSFGVMTTSEEPGVEELVRRTADRLRRAGAGPDEMGSRYASLLELLWKLKQPNSLHSPQSPCVDNGRNGTSSSNARPLWTESPYKDFSSTNDFSWLDISAVGDFVSGDQMPGTDTISMDVLRNSGIFGTAADADAQQTWQSYLLGEMANNFFF